ncbi:MAG TPA: gliding motility-associated C-terminal domain-containing protein [Bacteroidales bacterium]|nr:gliding motility-associated C-terminal domain-containing protein [Bacteroidales bacterium]
MDVIINELPEVTITETSQATCGADNGIATATVSNGNSPYSFIWDTGDSSPDGVAENLSAGIHTVTVSDNNSCSTVGTINITSPTDLAISAVQTSEVSCNSYNNGEAEIEITGGIIPYTLSWDNGITNGTISDINTNNYTISNLTAGTYTISVVDASSCLVVTTLEITEPEAISSIISIVDNVDCYGEQTGEAQILISGGIPNFDIAWSNGTINGNLNNVNFGPHTLSSLGNGTYTITITDANNCEYITNFNITQPLQLSLAFSNTNNVSCYNGSDGSFDITIINGTPNYNLSWDNGTTNGSLTNISSGPHTIENLDAGTYSISVEDNNGCTASSIVIINEPASVLEVTNIDIADASCIGVDDGSAEISITGGVPPYNTSWSHPNGSGNIITNVTAGTYNLTVTDSWGCIVEHSVVIDQPEDGLSSDIETTHITCTGGNDGTITLTTSGGTPPYNYVWDTPLGNNNTANGLSEGIYNVTVTDAGTCIESLSINIEVDPNTLSATIVSENDALCYGTNTGSIEASGINGNSPYTYIWDDPSNTTDSLLENIAAGTYHVTVSDNNNCSVILEATISEPDEIIINTENIVDVACYSENTGEINISVSGGTPPYLYEWEDESGNNMGINSPHISTLHAGTYTVSVYDNNSCGPTVQIIEVTEPANPLSATISEINQPTCNGDSDGSITVNNSGGTLPILTYEWSNPISSFTGDTPTGLAAGYYSVTITDNNSCTAEANFTLNQPDIITITNTTTPVTCNGYNDGSISALAGGGNGGFTYYWEDESGNNIGNTSDLNNQTAGNYYLTVTDAFGCTSEEIISITEPTPILLSLSHIDASTYGNSDGSVSVLASGSHPPYTFEWEDADNPGTIISTNQTVENLTEGTYCVTVTDSQNCTAEACETVNQPPDQLTGILDEHNNISCFNAADGSIIINGFGGTPPYQYEWQDEANNIISTEANINNLDIGNYYLTITDALNYVWDTVISITQPNEFIISNTNSDELNCFGDNNGEISIELSGGTEPYSYIWEDDSGNNIETNSYLVNNLTAGTYYVTVNDANNCGPLFAEIEITQPEELIVEIYTVTEPLCYGDANGSLSLTITGGSLPISTYQWDDPINSYTSDNPSNLYSGNYSVSITDNNGCIAQDSHYLNEPPELNISLNSNQTSGYGASDGTVSLIVNGGTPDYSFVWENQDNPGTIISTEETATNLLAGTYCVTVTDINNCSVSNCIEVTEPGELLINLDIENIDCYNNNNGSILSTVSGGVAPYSYEWQDSEGNIISNEENIYNLETGWYYITVTDNNNYQATASAQIIQPNELTAQIITHTNLNCYQSNNGELSAIITGGTPDYNIAWIASSSPSDTLSTSTSISNLSADDYILTITDQNGCIFDTIITISQPDNIIITQINDNDIDCSYNNGSGSVSVTATGGTNPLNYSWYLEGNPIGSNNSSINNLDAGDYMIIVGDINNCPSDTGYFTINIPDPIFFNGIADSVSCHSGTDGSINLSPEGGNGNYSYTWTPDISNSSSANNLTADTYEIIITDDLSCQADTIITVYQPTPIQVNALQTQEISCFGYSDAIFEISISGGTEPYTLIWDNNGYTGLETELSEGTVQITDLMAGYLSFTVSDNNNCQFNENVPIVQPYEITYTFVDIIHPLCNGDQNGRIEIQASGGTGSFDFIWDNSGNVTTDNYSNNLGAGWHYFEIIDNSGCNIIDSIELIEPTEISINLIDTVFLNCHGDSNGAAAASVSGGTPDYQYEWYNSSIDLWSDQLSATGLPADTYTFIVTDNNNCVASDTLIVAQPEALTSIMGGSNPLCYQSSDGIVWITPGGGTSPYSFEWSIQNSINNDTIYNLTAGEYTVTVTDDNNCVIEDSVTLENPDELIISVSSTSVICNEQMGRANVSVTGGTPDYTYAWSNNNTDPIISELSGGIYYVTVKDANQCSAEASVEVEIEGNISASITQQTDILCYGDKTAILTSSSDGNSPFLYNWEPVGSSNQTISELGSGTYSLTITDSWGCQGIDSFSITEPPQIQIFFSTSDVDCKFAATGSARALVSGGTGSYTYYWAHNGENSIEANNLSAGNYMLQITDENSCVVTQTVTINEPDSALNATIITHNAKCYGSNDGQARALGIGGTAPYTYTWETPIGGTINQQETEDNLFPGNYYLTVIDNNSCTYSTQAFIYEPEPLIISIMESEGPSCMGHTDGYIQLDTIYGGTPPYSIYISGNQTNWEQEINLIDSIPAGVYRIDVVDANNCHHQGDALTIAINDSEIDCLQIPGAFSPNGDGYNDTWQISNIDMFPRILIQVYNRWGQLLYEASISDDFWDGTFNHSPVPAGTYLYRINLHNDTEPRLGTVTIIR